MSETPELPLVESGVIDADGLEALFLDLAACTQVTEVQLKGSARAHSAAVRPSLDEALAALRAGVCRGVQVRYTWKGDDWCDTVLAQPGTGAAYRVVRLRVDQGPA